MNIPFRQGIINHPAGFLQATGATVRLAISAPEAVAIAFADGESNYLHTFRATINNAWVGPFAGGTDYWLYWDIHQKTGLVTFGHTLREPAEGSVAPSFPQNDQHWFDTSTNKMMVWNTTANRWVHKIRVFAAKYQSGAVFISMSINSPMFTGTQVGLAVPTGVPTGSLVFDTNGNAIKRNNGTFFTTEDVVVAGISSSAQIKLGASVIQAEAEANLPAYTVVQFSDFNQIVATPSTPLGSVYGIIENSVTTGSTVNVALQGFITNPSWDWTAAGVSAPLYVNAGQLTATPGDGDVIAYVVDKNTVVLYPTPQQVPSSGGGGSVATSLIQVWSPAAQTVGGDASFTNWGGIGYNWPTPVGGVGTGPVPGAYTAEYLDYDGVDSFTVSSTGVFRLTITARVVGTEEKCSSGTVITGVTTLGPSQSAHWKPSESNSSSLSFAMGYTDQYVFSATENDIMQIGIYLSCYTIASATASVTATFQVEKLSD